MNIYIIIPTYNERDTIATTITTIMDSIEHTSVIVVDDNSPDGTSSIVQRLMNQYPHRISLIQRQGKLGLGSAYIAGFTSALAKHADIIFEMDADGSHNPHDIPRMVTEIEKGADVVIGSRRITGGAITGWGMHRHMASWGAMTLSRILLGLHTKDVTAGFRAYTATVIRSLSLNNIKSNGYAFQEEMLYRCERAGYNVVEIPVTFTDRVHGVSKLSKKDIIEFFVTLLRLRFTR